MPESIQQKLSRTRPPRVQISYDVEVGDAIVMKELPLVVGVMSDLSGDRKKELPKLKDRKFAEIDRDNFDEVLKSVEPHLEYSVENKLTDDGGNMKIELDFKSMDDFHPDSLVQQIEPLRKLFEARQKLLDLFVKLDGNDDLDNLLQAIVKNTDELEEIKKATATEEETKSAASTNADAGVADTTISGEEDLTT